LVIGDDLIKHDASPRSTRIPQTPSRFTQTHKKKSGDILSQSWVTLDPAEAT
jgi:hypothetical protein